ncbi:MAG: hypothetical protein ACRDFB_00885 [Rhabdochlamydiaceae bacterium]
MQKAKSETLPFFSVADLKELTRQAELDELSYDTKCVAAKGSLEKLACKFSRIVDRSIFKELDRLTSNLEAVFINQRSADHLAKLAYSVYFIRRKLSRNTTLFSFKDHFDIRIFPSLLHFTFGSKPILSIVTHAHLKDKYEVFDEEQIPYKYQKIVAKAVELGSIS